MIVIFKGAVWSAKFTSLSIIQEILKVFFELVAPETNGC